MVGEEEHQVNAEPKRLDHFPTFVCHCMSEEIKKGQDHGSFSLNRMFGEMAATTNSIAKACASSFLGVSKGLQKAQQEICKCILVMCCQCMYVIMYLE